MCLMGLYLCKNPFNCTLKDSALGNSLVVQWLGQRAFTAEGAGQGTKIPQAESVAKKTKRIVPFTICIFLHYISITS